MRNYCFGRWFRLFGSKRGLKADLSPYALSADFAFSFGLMEHIRNA
jgi:hypothetical protein